SENGECDIFSLFGALWKVASSSFMPFTYAFVPQGEEGLARKLLFDTLGDLTAEQLKKIHFSKKKKKEKRGKENSFGFKTDQDTIPPNFFYTDPSYQEVIRK